MNDATETVTVSILDRDYQVACPPDERDALRDAARFLDERMREIRSSGKVFGLDRIAVMAALNIAHDMKSQDTAAGDATNHAQAQVDSLAQRVDIAVERLRQIKL